MTERDMENVYLAAQMLRQGRTFEARELLDKLLRDGGWTPPPDPQVRRVERERVAA